MTPGACGERQRSDADRAWMTYRLSMPGPSRRRIGDIPKFCETAHPGRLYHSIMIDADAVPTRTLTLVLPESDWKALRAAEPDAIGWLRGQIQQRLAGSGGPWVSHPDHGSAPSPDAWWSNEDEY